MKKKKEYKPKEENISFDSDALAFITSADITDNIQKTAVNTFVTDLKTYGIWTKMKALYPFDNSLFPEYTANQNGDVYPQHNN